MTFPRIGFAVALLGAVATSAASCGDDSGATETTDLHDGGTDATTGEGGARDGAGDGTSPADGGMDSGTPGSDPTFASGGLALLPPLGSSPVFSAAVALQADGKLVALGSDFRRGFGVLARFGVDGVLDPTFGSGGRILLALGQSVTFRGVVVAPDQSILVSAFDNPTARPQSLIARLTPSGGFDATWGKAGIVTLVNDDAGAFAVQADGKVVVGYEQDGAQKLTRLLANGGPDSAFGTAGVVAMPAAKARAIAIAPTSAKILIGDTSGITRLLPTGALDTTFAGSGKAAISSGVSSLAVLSDERVIAGGDGFVASLTAAGALDTAFAGDGTASTPSLVAGVAVQTNGMVVAATSTGSLLRFDTAGVPDSSFGSSGSVSLPVASTSYGASGVLLRPDGRMAVSVTLPGSSPTRPVVGIVSRLVTGAVDTSFGAAGDGTAAAPVEASREVPVGVAAQANGRVVVAGASIQYAAAGVLFGLTATGVIDPSFGVAGRVDEASLVPTSMIVDDVGRILVTGAPVSGAQSIQVIRYLPEGQRDRSFGGSDAGVVSYRQAPTQAAFAYALARDPSGRILVAGSAAPNAATVVRLSATGAVDTTFDGDGFASIPMGLDGKAVAVASQPDSKVLVAGSGAGQNADILGRFDANGGVDTTFGQSGKTSALLGLYGSIRQILVQPDGKVLVGGFVDKDFTDNVFIARYTAAGLADTTFGGPGGGSGKVTETIGAPRPYASIGIALESPMIALAPDGRIYAAATIVVDGDEEMVVVRYLPDGQTDATFGPDGRRIFSRPHGYDAARALAFQSDGKLLLAGRAFTPTGASDFAVARFLP
jgi:uncharacterized delta-60 repeat protein